MCGFVGIVADTPVASEIHVGLQAVQHRGQDSAGIATMMASGDRFHIRRGLGTAAQALDESDLAALDGPVGIGHVRYPTIGRGKIEDTQPFFFRQPGVLMAHNGQLTNAAELAAGLADRSIHLLSQCDVEPALCELADSLMQRRRAGHTLEDALGALGEMQQRIRGAYSIVAALMVDRKPTLVALRDPHAIRPLVIGRRDDGAWIAASETVALDALGFRRGMSFGDTPGPGEPAGGEAVLLRAGEPPVRRALTSASRAPCIFETIYFARPDSALEERSVYEVRLQLGRALALRLRQKRLVLDVVVPVPDTSRPAATAIAEELALPLREGLIKNRYSGRTFIMPDQLMRKAALRLKLNPLPSELRGRKVLLVDDSIVRGTTLGRVVQLVRDGGAAEVHLAIHSPPVKNPCFYGIDMSTEEELFARRFPDDLAELEVQAARELGADSLTYLPVDSLDAVFGRERCSACFDGNYPLAIGSGERDHIASDRRQR